MGTMNEVREKLHKKQQGAIKRERAIAYSRSQQVMNLGSPKVGFFLFVLSI